MGEPPSAVPLDQRHAYLPSIPVGPRDAPESQIRGPAANCSSAVQRGPINGMQRRRTTVGGWVRAGQVLRVSRGSVTFRRLPICSGKFVSLTLAVCKCDGKLIWELEGVKKVAVTCTHHARGHTAQPPHAQHGLTQDLHELWRGHTSRWGTSSLTDFFSGVVAAFVATDRPYLLTAPLMDSS